MKSLSMQELRKLAGGSVTTITTDPKTGIMTKIIYPIPYKGGPNKPIVYKKTIHQTYWHLQD